MLNSMLPYVINDTERDIFRVNRQAYCSQEIFDKEITNIFNRVWVYLGHESEVPNAADFLVRTIIGRPLIFCRDTEGKLQVFFNTCRHRGAELCRVERGNSRAFRCFYHAWSFSTKGELVGIPGREGYPESFNPNEFALTSPRWSSYRGFVFVTFNPKAADLQDYLGPALEYLDLVADHSVNGMEIVSGEHRYTIGANWKLLVENSLDGYHLMPLHATYFDYLRSSGTEVEANRETLALDLGRGHAVIVDRAPWGRPTARWKPSLGEETRPLIEERRRELEQRLGAERAERVANTDRNLLIFPNLVINDMLAITIRGIWPVAPNKMEVTAWAMARKDDTPALREATLTNFVSFLGPGGFATPDDIEALESIQRTMGAVDDVPWSDMSRGMSRTTNHPTVEEEQTRAFWKHWNHVMTQKSGGLT
jgi:p-cumate 2,3-dioxygenase subunit alpha